MTETCPTCRQPANSTADEDGSIHYTPSICSWVEEPEGSLWKTQCGKEFALAEGTPRQNDMVYCCYYGALTHEVTKDVWFPEDDAT